jgi:hypothetical protein
VSSPTKFCKHCGAQISADAQFCKACGKPVESPAVLPVAPAVAPALAVPSVQAGSSRSVWLITGCVIAVIMITCIAVIAVGSFFYVQNNAQARATPTMLAILIPSTPTLSTGAQGAPSPIVPLPTFPVPAITPTTAPTPTSPSTPAPTSKCPPVPALPAGVLFSDDFASRQVAECNGWDIKTGDNSDDIWAPNQLTISQKRTQWVSVNEPDGEYGDFGAETQAQPIGNNYTEYGLAFRDSTTANKSSYYIFGIRTDGKYYVSKLIADDWVDPDPVSVTASPAIKPGAAQNTIGVIVQGGTISLYINRVLVKTFTDSAPLGKGQVGLMVASADKYPAVATFSKLTILTPDKARAEWSGAPAPTQPIVPGSSQPQIISLEFPNEIPFDTNRYDGQIRFRDDGGDLQRVAFDAPPGSIYPSFGFEFTNPAMRWVEGNATSTSGVFKFSYSCGQPSAVANLTFAVTLYDKGGNKSAPYPFSFVCKSTVSNTLTVFFTIQNGSPTGYVIDKQGIKHPAPSYLTISDLHVAPGDRIVIQTDQPRFSLLFDCGTSPQTFTPCDFVADAPARLPAEIRKNASGSAYLNISRADNWAGVRSNFPSQRYPADPVLRIGFGN